ncbi:MAG: phage terminase large subunit family protein, partial [Pseudomonas sp.]|nr:phage terminase large subunit family protein [Pseudomonas sp.]
IDTYDFRVLGTEKVTTKTGQVDAIKVERVRDPSQSNGAELWIVGTDTAKDWIYNRYSFETGPGALHFAKDLPDEFFQQCVAERKIARYVKGYKRIEWVKSKAERNEALDLMVYNLAMANFLGLHRYGEHDWDKLRQALAQASLFDQSEQQPARPQVSDPVADDQDKDDSPSPAAPAPVRRNDPPPPQPAPRAAPQPIQRRSSSSGYLKRR